MDDLLWSSPCLSYTLPTHFEMFTSFVSLRRRQRASSWNRNNINFVYWTRLIYYSKYLKSVVWLRLISALILIEKLEIESFAKTTSHIFCVACILQTEIKQSTSTVYFLIFNQSNQLMEISWYLSSSIFLLLCDVNVSLNCVLSSVFLLTSETL